MITTNPIPLGIMSTWNKGGPGEAEAISTNVLCTPLGFPEHYDQTEVLWTGMAKELL